MPREISNEERMRLLPIFKQRRMACLSCPTPCNPPPNILDITKTCPLPESRWDEVDPRKMGLGDIIEILAKPVARALKLGCLDGEGNLKPESGCAKRRDALNRLSQ